MKRKTFLRAAIRCAAFVSVIFCLDAQAANLINDLQFRLFNVAAEGEERTTRIIVGDVLRTSEPTRNVEDGGGSPVSDIGASVRQTSIQDAASINNVTVTEGNSGTTNAVFTITLDAARSENSVFNFQTADGTATADGYFADYVAQSGTLTIPSGTLTGTISVPVVGDTHDEPNEKFYVNFSGVNLTASGQGVGTIIDDETSRITVENVYIYEGDSGTKNADFVVRLTKPHTADATLKYATADFSATAGSDYVAKSGTLTIPAGATEKIVSVVINGDTQVELDESFYFNLSDANLPVLRDQAGGIIYNDDRQIVANLSITDAYAMAYTNTETVTKFTLTLSAPVSFPVTVGYRTIDATAKAGVDYRALPLNFLTFNPGQTRKDIWVYGIKGDGDYTTNKTFRLYLDQIANINVDQEGIGTIADAPLPGSLIFSEFRFRGANGAYDEFIELYNNRDYPIIVTSLNGDDYGGWSVIAVSPLSQLSEVGYIPLGTTIPARGHYLFANNRTDQQNVNIGYSLGSVAIPDRTYTADIEDGSGLALLHVRGFVFGGNGITQTYRQDTVGFQGGSNLLSLEGSGLAPAGGIVESGEWSFIRRCANGGTPQDTNDAVADWRLISPNGAVLSSQQSRVGTTRPANLASPSGNECLNIAAPTAASVTVSGRVISPRGSGLTKARVTLTDARGETRTVITGTFGAYRFTNSTLR